MDGSEQNMETLKLSTVYWRQDIMAKSAFVTRHNIAKLLISSGFNRLGLLHIDLDGNDYWILEAIDLDGYTPDI